FVTHDQSEAMTLGDCLAIVDHGRLLQIDTPERVLSHPMNKYVASFVGSPEMVFLEGSVEAAGINSYTFVSGPIRIPVRGVGQLGQVTIGLRPWDVSVARAAHELSISGVVAGVERLGSSDQLFIDFRPPPGQLGSASGTVASVRALVRAYDYNIGDLVWVGFDPDRALFFDAEGSRLESMSFASRLG
ncbi:MAG: TOBE domain-containing protein, partial [Thermoplasmata archaeon]